MMLPQGCNKEWDDHYNTVDETTVKDKILAEMEAIPEISKFTEAVKQVRDLDDLLSQNRLYTVFAPNNEAFDKIDPAILNDTTLLFRLVKYHFINGKFKLKDIIAADLTTFNNKYLNFSFEDSTSTVLIDGYANIIDADHLSLNGMIQIINEPLLPKNNLYEYLKYNDYSSRIGYSIPQYNIMDFNREASTPISTNEDGKTIYDSVFTITNPLLYIGESSIVEDFYYNEFRYTNIESERRNFTMVIPSDFSDAINEVNLSPFLNSPIPDQHLAGPILSNLIYRDIQTRETIIEDIYYAHSLFEADTSEVELYFAGLLLNNYDEEINLSNGVMHTVNSFEYDLTWLIKDQGNKREGQSEANYQSNLLSDLTSSDNIDAIDISTRNIKLSFYDRNLTLSGETVKINFQPSDSPVPEGYLPDFGNEFADRGNDFSYGWVGGDINAASRDRGGSDPVLTTLIHMNENGAHSWEFELPNGNYVLNIIAGDEANADQTNTLLIEDIVVIDNVPNNNFDEFNNIAVNVSDGMLTISPHQGDNQKLVALEIIFPIIDTEPVDSLAYEEKYGEWVNFNLQGGFYPVDYKLMLRGKNKESGIYKVEVDGQEIANYDFSTTPSGDLDTKFDQIGIVSLNSSKTSLNLKFTLSETHPGVDKDKQYLWIREIKLVPILE